MDMYFEDEKMKILKYIDDRGEELSKLLHRFKEEFDEDRAQRLEREAVIVKQLTDHEQEVNESFEKQIVSMIYMLCLSLSLSSRCVFLPPLCCPNWITITCH